MINTQTALFTATQRQIPFNIGECVCVYVWVRACVRAREKERRTTPGDRSTWWGRAPRWSRPHPGSSTWNLWTPGCPSPAPTGWAPQRETGGERQCRAVGLLDDGKNHSHDYFGQYLNHDYSNDYFENTMHLFCISLQKNTNQQNLNVTTKKYTKC